jgi:aryl-alcohol dehydrogenase-like predicted oxidoreductase
MKSIATTSPYTFGSMSLGRSEETLEQDIAVARRAMEAGVWFHSSPTYNRGFTYMVLRHAFDEARHQVPRLILKLRDGSPKLLRFEAEDACRRLGIDAIDVAQLVSMQRGPGCLTEQLVTGGAIADELASLRQRGLIKQAVIFVDRDNSDAGVAALASQLVDGLTLYWNACQRDCSEVAWQRMRVDQIPVLALRTIAGGPRDTESAARRLKAGALAQASGCADAVEFALRLASSIPVIRTTIGGTATLSHLERYLTCAASPKPLPADVLDQWDALVRDGVTNTR